MPPPASRPALPKQPGVSLLGRIGHFFSEEAWLSLFTLLLLLGLVFGLQHFAQKIASKPVTVAAERKGRGIDAGAPAALDGCGQIVVQLSEAGTLRQLAALLRQFDATVVYGPDENGAFALRAGAAGDSGQGGNAHDARNGRAVAVATAMEKSELVVTANARECR